MALWSEMEMHALALGAGFVLGSIRKSWYLVVPLAIAAMLAVAIYIVHATWPFAFVSILAVGAAMLIAGTFWVSYAVAIVMQMSIRSIAVRLAAVIAAVGLAAYLVHGHSQARSAKADEEARFLAAAEAFVRAQPDVTQRLGGVRSVTVTMSSPVKAGSRIFSKASYVVEGTKSVNGVPQFLELRISAAGTPAAPEFHFEGIEGQ